MNMKKSLKLILGIALTCFCFNAFADDKPKPVPNKVKPAPSATEIMPSPPELGEESYLLMDYLTGEVLVGKDVHKRIIPASLTKMMTSYVIGQEILSGRVNLDDQVTISQNAWSKNYGDSSKMFIEVGKKVSVRDLNLGIIIQSGNDACIAMAEHIAGSEDAFASLMNEWAKYIGMQDSNFVNSHGLYHENHYSSSYDMAILGRALIHDLPTEYKIYSQKEFTFNGIKQINRNRLLWDSSLNVDGIKTGHLSQVGYNLVTSAVDPESNFRLIAVVIGANSERQRAEDSKALLTYGFRFYKQVPVIKKGKPLIEQKIIYGAESKIKLGSATDIQVAVPRNKAEGLKVSIKLNEKSRLEAPIKSGVEVGTIFIRTADDQLVHQSPLVTLEDVAEGGWLGKSWDWTVTTISDLF